VFQANDEERAAVGQLIELLDAYPRNGKPSRGWAADADAARNALDRPSAIVGALLDALLEARDTHRRYSNDYETDVFAYRTSDQLRFVRGDGEEPVDLADVPRLVRTEAMRDVDLFVGITSIGTDPEWLDRGKGRRFETYWTSSGARDRRADKLWLPFDDDAVLSLVLSKAFLLADDTAITDDTITEQIKRR
jgi:hypothetical protein